MLRNVMFRGMLGVFGCMDVMAMSSVGVMRSCLVVAGFMVLGCFLVVARSVLVVFRCLGVMMGCLF